MFLSGFFFILRIADFKCCVSYISTCDGVIQYCKCLWICDILTCKHVENIMQKWHPCVLCLNLWGCCSFHWPSFKVSVNASLLGAPWAFSKWTLTGLSLREGIGNVLQFLSHLFAHCCILSNVSISHMYWEAQNWTQYSRYGLTCAEGKNQSSLDLLATLLMQPRIPPIFFWQGHIRGSTWSLAGLPGPFLSACFQPGLPPTCSGALSCPFPDARFCISWTS